MNTFHLAVVIIAIGVVVIACLSGICSLMMATDPTDQSRHRPARIDLKAAWLWLRSRCSPAAGRLTRLTPWLLATSKGSNDPQ